MAQKGRPKKQTTDPETVNYAKLLKESEQEQQVQLETSYKDLAKIKDKVSSALTQVRFIDDCDSLSQAAFKAGRAYGPLDEADDKLKEILDEIYSNNDLDHWDDINND
jgi:hypothetical protein